MSMPRSFILRLTFFLCVGTTLGARGDTYPRQPNLDVVHYAFHIQVSDDNGEISGRTMITVQARSGHLTEIQLDLASRQASGKGMTVAKVALEDQDVPYVHENDRVKISLPNAIPSGVSKRLTIDYKGIPGSGFLIGKNRHGDRTFFSENWPDKAHQWLPTVDHPYDKATSEFFVTAPAHYQVVSNGLLQEETDLGDDRRLTHWKQSVPIAVWLNALAIAPFASHQAGTVKGLPLQTWVFRQDRDKLFPALEEPARRAVELFSEKVGPYPFEKVAGIQAVGFDGGMELASAIFYGQYSLSGRGTPALIAHEMAHQWFGDSVTETDWDDIWLSEGFATFFAHVYAEKYEGRQAYIDGLKRSRPIVFAAERREPKLAIIHDNLSDTRRILNSLVYQKGAWVLHMLREELGEEAFWGGIKTYYARYRDRNATTADFRKVMEASSKRDLGWFFDQWLKRPGSPRIEAKWTYDASTQKVKLDLAQTQPGDPYRLRLEVRLVEDGQPGANLHTIDLNERTRTIELPATKEPSTITLDPSSKLLFDAKVTRN